MSIHQTIYDTLHLSDEDVMALIGSGDIASVRNRRERMREFLATSEWSEAAYRDWIRKNNLPTKGAMAKNLAVSVVQAAKSSFREVDAEEQQARLDVCDRCELYLPELGRCGKCGCYVTFKVRLKAWNCPENKW